MTSTKNVTRWALLVDEKRARLISVDRNPNGFVRVNEQSTLENEQTEHQHSRPSPLKGKSDNTHAAFPEEDRALNHRFVKRVASWAETEAKKHGVERLEVFAPSKLLSDLSGSWSNKAPVSKETQHQVELAHLDTGHLAKHKQIEALLPGGAKV